MACITSENRDAWQRMADDAAAQRPYPGRRVRIDGGRKYKGKIGLVVRHERDRFGSAWRYGSDASHMLQDMIGRYGFRIQVRSDVDGSLFWCPADYATCVDGKHGAPALNDDEAY